MKLHHLLTFIFLLATVMMQPVFAQYSYRVSMNSGVSLPLGNFSGTVIHEDGFAQAGLNFGGEVQWFFGRYLGVGVQGSWNNNPIDVKALTAAKWNEDPFLVDLSIRSESFTTMWFSGGFYGRYPMGKNWETQASIAAGWMRCRTPYQLYRTTYYEMGPTYYEITSSRDDALVVIPGVAVQYLFARGIGFKADAKYISSKMSFPFLTSSGIRYDELKVRYISLTLALVIGL